MVNSEINIKPSLLLRGSGLTLTINEIEDIMKAIRPVENKETLLKGASRKINS